MPVMKKALEETSLAMILVYGRAKTQKTTWALRAAEEGYNVIMADMDYSFQVAQNLSPAAQARIYHLDMRMATGEANNSGALTLLKAAEGQVVYFDEELRKYVSPAKTEPERSYTKIDFTKLTDRDVLVVDSWTALCTAMSLATAGVTDPTAISKLEWDDYAKIRLALDHFIQNLTKLNCHVIVVGHSETYAKRKPDAKSKDKPEDAIESVRVQPMSISRAHAETLAKNFTDVLLATRKNASLPTTLSSKGSEDFDAGSRAMPPGSHKLDETKFSIFASPASLAKVANNAEFSSAALTTMSGEEIQASRGKSATIPTGKSPISLSTLGKK